MAKRSLPEAINSEGLAKSTVDIRVSESLKDIYRKRLVIVYGNESTKKHRLLTAVDVRCSDSVAK